MAEHFTARPDDAHGPLQECFFELLRFARLADTFGKHSVFESSLGDDGARSLAIRNLVPAPSLKAVSPTATRPLASPARSRLLAFYRDTLGLPHDTSTLDVGSPFRSEQLTVRVAMDVRPRFRDRNRSLTVLIDIVASQFAERPGNYLASSSVQLRLPCERIGGLCRAAPWRSQCGRNCAACAEADRDGFLARFVAGGQGVGFAVLGGAFGEGVGPALEIGSFPVPSSRAWDCRSTTSPTKSCVKEWKRSSATATNTPTSTLGCRRSCKRRAGSIRTETDAGVLYLLDDRFARREIRELLPAWWQVQPMFAAGR